MFEFILFCVGCYFLFGWVSSGTEKEKKDMAEGAKVAGKVAGFGLMALVTSGVFWAWIGGLALAGLGTLALSILTAVVGG